MNSDGKISIFISKKNCMYLLLGRKFDFFFLFMRLSHFLLTQLVYQLTVISQKNLLLSFVVKCTIILYCKCSQKVLIKNFAKRRIDSRHERS